jgi:hypothetical protein
MTQISRSEQMLIKAYRKMRKAWLKSSNTEFEEPLVDFLEEFEAHFHQHFPLGN